MISSRTLRIHKLSSLKVKIMTQYCNKTSSGFPHNFDLEIPGLFQDISRQFPGHFPEFLRCSSIQNTGAFAYCCAIHNIITVYNTEQVHRRKVWVPTAGRGFGGITPEKSFQFYVDKSCILVYFGKLPGYFQDIFAKF